MVKFRKKTRRKLKRKSKQSIMVGGDKYYCRTEKQLDAIKRDAARGTSSSSRADAAATAAADTTRMTAAATAAAERSMQEEPREKRKDRGSNSPIPREYLAPSPPQPPAIRRRTSSLSEDEEGGTGRKGGSKKIKRRKKKKTRKARGIIDDLRELCTTGRCGSPRPQTPTLRQLALTIEQNILRDLNKNKSKKTLTDKELRNIKAVANYEAARIINNSRSASKKKKKKRR